MNNYCVRLADRCGEFGSYEKLTFEKAIAIFKDKTIAYRTRDYCIDVLNMDRVDYDNPTGLTEDEEETVAAAQSEALAGSLLNHETSGRMFHDENEEA